MGARLGGPPGALCSAAGLGWMPTCNVRAVVLAVHIPLACQPLPSAAAFPASGALLCFALLLLVP